MSTKGVSLFAPSSWGLALQRLWSIRKRYIFVGGGVFFFLLPLLWYWWFGSKNGGVRIELEESPPSSSSTIESGVVSKPALDLAVHATFTFLVGAGVLVITATLAALSVEGGAVGGISRWWRAYRVLNAEYLRKEEETKSLVEEDQAVKEVAWYNFVGHLQKLRAQWISTGSLLLLRAALRAPILPQLISLVFSSLRTWLALRQAKGVGSVVDAAVNGTLTSETMLVEIWRVMLIMLAGVCIDFSDLLSQASIRPGAFKRQLFVAGLAAVMRQDLAWLKTQPRWRLSSTCREGASSVSSSLSAPLTALQDIVTIILVGRETLLIDWQLALFGILCNIALAQGLKMYISIFMERSHQMVYKKQEELQQPLADMLSNIKDYQLFASERSAIKQTFQIELEKEEVKLLATPADSVAAAVNRFITTFVSLSIRLFSAYRIVQGALSWGRFTEFQVLQSTLLDSLESIQTLSSDWYGYVTKSGNFFGIMAREPCTEGGVLAPTLPEGASEADKAAAYIAAEEAAEEERLAKQKGKDPIVFLDSTVQAFAAEVEVRKEVVRSSTVSSTLSNLSLLDVARSVGMKGCTLPGNGGASSASSTMLSSNSASAAAAAAVAASAAKEESSDGSSAAGVGAVLSSIVIAGDDSHSNSSSTSVATIVGLSSSSSSSSSSPSSSRLKLRGHVEFRDVVFKYPPAEKIKKKTGDIGWWSDATSLKAQALKVEEAEAKRRSSPPVINSISFTISPGMSAALCGKSGGGKTTIFQLLLAFFKVSSGQVLIDGENVANIDVSRLRRSIGLIEQKPRLVDGTVTENLLFGLNIGIDGEVAPTREEIETACRRADILKVINDFPNGFDEILGSKGRELSGGQQQRLSIARIFLRNPSILLCDEITSAQDTESEAEIQAGIAELMKDRTVIMVAHRLKTIEKCNLIMVLEGGKFLERGTHNTLFHLGGRYRWYVDQQSINRPGEEGGDSVNDAEEGPGEGGRKKWAAKGTGTTTTTTMTTITSQARTFPPTAALLHKASSVTDDCGSCYASDASDTEGEDAPADGAHHHHHRNHHHNSSASSKAGVASSRSHRASNASTVRMPYAPPKYIRTQSLTDEATKKTTSSSSSSSSSCALCGGQQKKKRALAFTQSEVHKLSVAYDAWMAQSKAAQSDSNSATSAAPAVASFLNR